MALRINPNFYLITGSLFWVLYSFFHIILLFEDQSYYSPTYRLIYLILLGSFVFSFYKYYDLVFPKISRKVIFTNFFKLFIYSVKAVFSLILIYILYLFKIGDNFIYSPIFSNFINEFVTGISLLFLIINFIFFKRLILFEATSIMKSIFLLFQYGAIIIFLFDIIFNFYPSPFYQYFLGLLFMVGAILFFNQKWIAYLHFDQKWKTILICFFLLGSNILIYQFFSLNNQFFTPYFDIQSLLFFVLLIAFNFSYISISVLINLFNLPTSPVFDDIENERYIARKVQENLIPIADVSGKGIPAALLMSNVQASLRTMVRHSSNLKKIVEELNFQINLRGLSERFVSIFIAIYDYKSQVLEYVNCGHPHPIIYYDKKVETLDKGSTVLGMFSELPKFDVSKVKIKNDFNVFCYTDGLTETQNDFGEFYGSKRLLKLFSDTKKKPQKFIKLVIDDLNNFRGNNLTDDDITLLMTKVKNG